MEVLGWLFALALSAILNGFALKTLWGWFVVETFGLRNLTIPQALGITLVVGFLTHQYVEDNRSFGEQLLSAFVYPVVFLIIGFLYHLFM